MKRQLSVVSFVLVTTACSSFDSTSSPGVDSPDASASNGASPLGPSSQYRLDVTAIPSTTMALRATMITVSVKITRLGGLADDVSVGLRGAPAGVTAKPIRLTYPADSVDLDVMIDAGAAQGPATGFSVAAQPLLHPELEATAAVSLEIHGRPGELDTTFATAGVLDAGAGSPFGVDPTGRVYAFLSADRDVLRRYLIDGQLDESFVYESAGRKTLGDPQFAFRDKYFYEFYSPNLTQKRIERHTLSGALDTTFASMGYVEPITYGFGRFLAVDSNGYVAMGCANSTISGANIFMRTDAGDPDTRASSGLLAYGGYSGFLAWGGASPRLGGAVYDSIRLASINTRMLIVLNTYYGVSEINYERSFNAGAPIDFGNVMLSGLVRDNSSRYVVSGLNAQITGNSGLDRAGLYMARVLGNGVVDTTFTFHEPGVAATDTRLVVNPLGGYYLAATEIVDDHTHCQAYRINTDGSIDASFGSARGITVGGADCTIANVFTQPDGRLLVATPQQLYRFWN